MCNIFIAYELLVGKRIVRITEKRSKSDLAYYIEEIARKYKKAEKIILIIDNLNRYTFGSLYETFIARKRQKSYGTDLNLAI